jgi:hypothetical protein
VGANWASTTNAQNLPSGPTQEKIKIPPMYQCTACEKATAVNAMKVKGNQQHGKERNKRRKVGKGDQKRYLPTIFQLSLLSMYNITYTGRFFLSSFRIF